MPQTALPSLEARQRIRHKAYRSSRLLHPSQWFLRSPAQTAVLLQAAGQALGAMRCDAVARQQQLAERRVVRQAQAQQLSASVADLQNHTPNKQTIDELRTNFDLYPAQDTL